MRSAIPILGLVHEVDVIRKADADDGFGGIVPGAETVIYDDLQVRITVMEDKDEHEMFGHASGRHWKVLADYAPNLQRSDFIRVAWGTQPNVASPSGLADEFPWEIVVSTPAGDVTLEWSDAETRYQDATENYLLWWNGSQWQFDDLVAPATFVFVDYLQTDLIACLDWSLIDANYSVVSQGGAAKDYRVVYVKHQIDDAGSWHHTSVVMELEDEDS